jgi:hypothetical protein
MVAETEPSNAGQASSRRDPLPRGRYAQRTVQSLVRLAGIQSRLILLRTKLTAKKIILYALLMAGAAGATLLGMIFLFVGIFRALTSVLALAVGHEWAPTLSCLICAMALLGTALGLALYAKGIFAEKSIVGEAPAADKMPSAGGPG